MIAPSWDPSVRQLRQFAVACLPGSALVGYGVARWTSSAAVVYVFVALGLAALVVGLARPTALRPLWVVMTALTVPVGWLASQIVLRALFFGVMTPLAIAFRWLGRDHLQLRKPRGESYWRERTARADPVGYFRQS